MHLDMPLQEILFFLCRELFLYFCLGDIQINDGLMWAEDTV